MTRRDVRAFAVAALVLGSSFRASAQRAVPMGLEQIVRESGTIVQARVVDTRTGRDPQSGALATWVTVDVREDFYGAPSMRFTFKQYGGEADGIAFYLADMPRFVPGEDAILMLGPPSKIGFQSCVGLNQGKFALRSVRGRAAVQQVQVASTLLKGVRTLKTLPGYPGTMDRDAFAETVRGLVLKLKKGGPAK